MSKTIVYVCDRPDCGISPATATRVSADGRAYKIDLCDNHFTETVVGAVKQKRRAGRPKGTVTMKSERAIPTTVSS